MRVQVNISQQKTANKDTTAEQFSGAIEKDRVAINA